MSKTSCKQNNESVYFTIYKDEDNNGQSVRYASVDQTSPKVKYVLLLYWYHVTLFHQWKCY